MNNSEKIKKAIEIGFNYGSVDGSHHKMWVIDQMLRILAEEKYEDLVKDFSNPFGIEEEDLLFYEWDCGIAP